VVATIDSGTSAGTGYTAVQAPDAADITAEDTITGDTTYVGDARAPLAGGDGTALVERGTCSF